MPCLSIAEIEALLGDAFPHASAFAKIISITEDELIARVDFKPEFIRPGGSVSGPTMMALVDTAAYYLILAHVGAVPLAVTSSLNIHFLARPKPGDVEATARFLRLGRRLAVCAADVRTAGVDDIVAHATVTYALPA